MRDNKSKSWIWSLISAFGVFAVMALIVAGKTSEKIDATEKRSIKNEECISTDREQHHKDILYIRENMITKDDLKQLIRHEKNH